MGLHHRAFHFYSGFTPLKPDPQRGNERTLPGKLSELLYGQVRSLPYADTLVLYYFFFFKGAIFLAALSAVVFATGYAPARPFDHPGFGARARILFFATQTLVDRTRLELVTSRLQGGCSPGLSYRPI